MRVPSGKAKMVGVPAVRCKYATFLLKYSYIRVMTTTFATALALCCMIYRPLRKLAIAQCIMLPATTYTVHVSRTTAMLHPLPWSSSPFAHRANHEWTCRHTLFFLSLFRLPRPYMSRAFVRVRALRNPIRAHIKQTHARRAGRSARRRRPPADPASRY